MLSSDKIINAVLVLLLLLVVAVSYSVVSCCSLLEFINGCGLRWDHGVLETCGQIHLEDSI